MTAAIVFDSLADFITLLVVMGIGTGIGRVLADGLLYWIRR